MTGPHALALRYPADRGRPRFHRRLYRDLVLDSAAVLCIVGLVSDPRRSTWRVVVELPEEAPVAAPEEARELARWYLESVGTGRVRYADRQTQVMAEREATEAEHQEARRWDSRRRHNRKHRRRRR